MFRVGKATRAGEAKMFEHGGLKCLGRCVALDVFGAEELELERDGRGGQ